MIIIRVGLNKTCPPSPLALHLHVAIGAPHPPLHLAIDVKRKKKEEERKGKKCLGKQQKKRCPAERSTKKLGWQNSTTIAHPYNLPFTFFHFNTLVSTSGSAMQFFHEPPGAFILSNLFISATFPLLFLQPLLLPSLESWHLAHPCFKSGYKPRRLSFTRARCQCQSRCYAAASRGKRGVPSMPIHFPYLHTLDSARLSCCG